MKVTGSVVELQTHLQLTRGVPLTRDLPEVGVVNTGVRRIENHIVEEVEGLSAELEVPLFSNSYVELPE